MSIDLSLERIRHLYTHLPPYTRPTFHVAGTNGKGSVSCLLSSILLASDPPLSVGRFNSPHLVSVNDCITINNQAVTLDTYNSTRDEVEKLDKEYGVGASSFEILTLTALLIFERTALDIVVLEVGMGGRLDATNIIPDECVLVSILTAVDLDHQAFLGNTVVDIAKEKAAIARKDTPFVLGRQTHDEVVDSVTNIVERNGGLLQRAAVVSRAEQLLGDSNKYWLSLSPSTFQRPSPQFLTVTLPSLAETIDVQLPLHGEHQRDNLGLAGGAINALLTQPSCSRKLHFNPLGRINSESIARGIGSAQWPGRLSFHKVSPHLDDGACRPLIVLADGAHNPSSSTTLSVYVSELLSLISPETKIISLTYILALSHSPPKIPLQTLSPLLPPRLPADGLKVKVNVAVLGFTPPAGMPWVKSVSPSELREVVTTLAPGASIWEGSELKEQLKSALEWAAHMHGDEDGLVILAGSLYLVADFYRLVSTWD